MGGHLPRSMPTVRKEHGFSPNCESAQATYILVGLLATCPSHCRTVFAMAFDPPNQLGRSGKPSRRLPSAKRREHDEGSMRSIVVAGSRPLLFFLHLAVCAADQRLRASSVGVVAEAAGVPES
jgi:hypothetical protein